MKRKMKLYSAGLALALLSSSLSSALPPKEHKERVHEQKLSDQDHERDGEHNNDYDHDAFLGQKEARDFDQLTPEESKEKLGIIVDKIDRNHDGVVTEDELQHWIQYVQKKYVIEDTDRMWKEHKLDDAGLSWESYRKNTYGYEYDPEEAEDFSEMVNRDTRKFKQADENGDGYLSKEEFASFLHPEEHEHMKDIVVLETMEDIDKDKDGKISLDEYIGDMWPNKDEEEPEWVKGEREQFSSYRDTNGDGFMDKDEVKNWIIPPNYDHSEAEAKHLIYETDENKDGVLTKQEILDKYDIFVGSQATDFGDALTRHDEF